MFTIIVLTIIIAASSADRRCTGVYIDNRYYNLNIIKEGINNLSDLAMNRRDNSLFFIFEDLTETPMTVLGHINLDTNRASVIYGIRNATSIAIDHVQNKVYVGGADGLFKINDRNIPEQLPVQDYVRSVYFKDVLYFTNARREVYKFEDGYTSPVQELRGLEVEKLILDNDNNIFFTKDKDLFRVKSGTRALNTHELIKANFIAADKYSKAYVCTRDGLYGYNKYKYVFDKMANLPGLKAITFNNVNEPIYAVFDKIVQLSLSSIACFED